MKSYLGKHSTDWHIFLSSVWYVAMRPELSDQDRKAIESALALQCAQPNFLLLVMPKGNNSSAAREQHELPPSLVITFCSTRQSWLAGRETAMENFPLVNNLGLIKANDHLRSALGCISFHCSGTFLFLEYLPLLSSPDKILFLGEWNRKRTLMRKVGKSE